VRGKEKRRKRGANKKVYRGEKLLPPERGGTPGNLSHESREGKVSYANFREGDRLYQGEGGEIKGENRGEKKFEGRGKAVSHR